MIDSNGVFVDDPIEPVAPVIVQSVTDLAGEDGQEIMDSASSEAEDLEVTTTEETQIDEVNVSEGLSTIIQRLLGEYVPKTQTVTVIGSDGTTVTNTEYVPGLAGLDYYWLTGAILFAMMLHGILALVGVLFKRG